MNDYEQLLEKALFLTNQKHDFAAAFTLWKQALDRPEIQGSESGLKRAELLLNVALCALQLERYEESAEYCDAALEEYAELDDASDEVQRVLAILVDAATLAGDFEHAMSASEMAHSALEKDPLQCSCYTLTMMAQKRAFLARSMDQPEEAEEAMAFALEQLDYLLSEDEIEPEIRREATYQKARLLEIRAENRIQGQALEIAELDLKESIKLYQRCGRPGQDSAAYARELLSSIAR